MNQRNNATEDLISTHCTLDALSKDYPAVTIVDYGRQIQIVGYNMQNKTMKTSGAGRCYYQLKR